MHKLIEYVCDELEDLERKVEKGNKLSMTEIQYMDTLAHAKKNLLKSDEMMEESDYSMDGGSYARGNMRTDRGGNSYRYDGETSYARGRGRNARRDSMGRYSTAGDGMIEELRDLMNDAPDEKTRMEFQRFISKMESM